MCKKREEEIRRYPRGKGRPETAAKRRVRTYWPQVLISGYKFTGSCSRILIFFPLSRVIYSVRRGRVYGSALFLNLPECAVFV